MMMNEEFKPILSAINERLGIEASEFRDEVTLMASPENMVELCQILQGEFGFAMLIDETAVDYGPQATPRFHIVYKLYSMEDNVLLGIRVPLGGDDPHLPTLEPVYPNANWYEREIWDMFGIHFDGHSDPRRILMPDDWVGFPQRKDYPLGYEEVQFTFNFDEIDVRKPHPKE
jgi:NADH-quinone oxidoreductase subunit C